MYTVLVCRACCCGTQRKHPDVDHDEQQEQIRAAAATVHGARVRVVDCLGICSMSNVLVVRDRSELRRPAIWLGGVLSGSSTEAVCDWLRAGGPSVALPAEVQRHVIPSPGTSLPVERTVELLPIAGA